jgi:DHA1 family bicyclomycin/chloramphenicol resistance-like MFS transporter
MKRNDLFVPICLILLGASLWPEMELMVPSLPEMKRVFDVSNREIQNLLTANFIGFFLGVLFAGPLCDSLGRKSVLKMGAILYLLSSLACALSPNFGILTLARFVQGFAMTGPVIAGGVLLMDLTKGSHQIFWMSLGNACVTFAMALAPIIGSWINSIFGYQGNLWSILILGILGIVPALIFIPESLPPESRKKFELGQLVKNYQALLTNWSFMSIGIPICSLAAAYWIYVGVSALYMVDYLGIPDAHYGWYQGPIVGTFSVFSLASSKLLGRFGLLNCVKAGIFSMLLGFISLLTLSLIPWETPLGTTIPMMLWVGGMAPLCSLLFPIALGVLPQDLQGSAQSMINAIRLLLASLGTALLGFVYKGPFLPIVMVMGGILIISLWILWTARGRLSHQPTVGQGMPPSH